MVAAEIRPDMLELSRSGPKIVCPRCQYDRIDRPCRSPANDRKRVFLPLWQHFGQSFEHADLEGTTRTAAR